MYIYVTTSVTIFCLFVINLYFIKNYLKYLKSAGLSGVETHTVKHTEYEQAMYYKGAKELNLLTTAGSDFHDEERTPVFGVDYEPTEFLKPILECLKEREKNKYEEYSRD